MKARTYWLRRPPSYSNGEEEVYDKLTIGNFRRIEEGPKRFVGRDLRNVLKEAHTKGWLAYTKKDDVWHEAEFNRGRINLFAISVEMLPPPIAAAEMGRQPAQVATRSKAVEGNVVMEAPHPTYDTTAPDPHESPTDRLGNDPEGLIRLIIYPARRNPTRLGAPMDHFSAYLDGQLVYTGRQPLYDGARKLLALGYPPDALMTMRHHDRPYDSWNPSPIGELAEWTVHESDRGGLQRRRWRPYPKGAGR